MKDKSASISVQSIQQKLVNLSHKQKEDPNHILIRYAIERFLYRLSQSPYNDKFILKGAMLFALWRDKPYRPTRDLDLLGCGIASGQNLKTIFQKILTIPVQPDGIEFEPDSISIQDIRGAQEYPGKRVGFSGSLGNARLKLQVDIGFGDAITPKPVDAMFPSLLNMPKPQIKAYPIETAIAEKLHAMVAFDMAISRMKDFYDLWIICRFFEIDGRQLLEAIKTTFQQRNTTLPLVVPTALTTQFSQNTDKVSQWNAFIKRSRQPEPFVNLEETIGNIFVFLWPPLKAASEKQEFLKRWTSGHWQNL
jgi:predicted nucleotidyltransferase component of viral defense system